MPTEVGNLSRLAFIQEVAFGTTPATPAGQTVRKTGFSLNADRNYIDNPELRTDGMTATGRGGALRGKGSINGKLSYGTYDAFLAASLGNFDWFSNVIKIKPILADTGATVQMTAATRTLTRPAGSFTADGFVVGDYVTLSGFTNAGNNGVCQLATVGTTTMTFNASPTSLTPVDEAANANVSITLNTRPSFTMEKAHMVNGIYFPFTGCVIDGFEMSGKVNEAIDIKFDLVTKAVGNEAVSSVFTSITAVNTNPLITAWDGTIKRNTVTLANVVGWTLKATRNLDQADVVGSSVLYDIQPKAAKITGTMELHFDSMALYTDMRAENDVVFQLNLGPGGTKSYTIDLTLCRIKTWKSEPKEGLMTAMVEFESFAPISGTNTALMLTRLP